MSRGFVKEGDQEELPIIPPRAALPSGAINYVTPNGWKLLLAEKQALEQQRKSIPTTDEAQHRRETAFINGKLKLLQTRMDSARIIEPTDNPFNEVRFGAVVTYQMLANKRQNTFQIVGVDEADVKQKKIAFVAPIARVLIGHQAGEIVDFNLGGEQRKLKIIRVKY